MTLLLTASCIIYTTYVILLIPENVIKNILDDWLHEIGKSQSHSEGWSHLYETK